MHITHPDDPSSNRRGALSRRRGSGVGNGRRHGKRGDRSDRTVAHVGHYSVLAGANCTTRPERAEQQRRLSPSSIVGFPPGS